jgi:hypothetical protein
MMVAFLPTNGDTNMSLEDSLNREARRVEEDTLYSAKGHFEAARIWSSLHLWLGIPISVLAAVAGASALSQFDNHNTVAGVLAILVSVLAAVNTFLNPNERANAHLNAGNRFNSLRNRARIFCEIDSLSQMEEKELVQHLKELSSERDELNQGSPQISRSAFKRARKRIEGGEANYIADRTS